MAEIRHSGTWGSALSTEEFAAIRSVGFEPVGQVLGAAVYNIGFSGGYNCPGAWSGFGSYAQAYRSVTQVSGRGGYGSFGPLTQAMYDARHLAISRMTTECAELGGHGIVGVSLSIGSFPAGGLEFKAIGTAVRAPGSAPLAQPFSSDLSGQDFAKLIHVGLGAGRPGAGHLGRGQARRLADRGPDPLGRGQRRGGRLHRAGQRHPARRPPAAREGRAPDGRGRRRGPADGHAGPRAGVPDPGSTAKITSWRPRSWAPLVAHSASVAKPPPPLAILSLDPQRRQAARVRLGR